MKKAMTIVVVFEDGAKPEKVGFGDKVCGGEVVGLAAYDLMYTMEIAEQVLEESYDDECREAMEKINSHIVHGTRFEL
jgi:hypothetical protein